MIVDEIKNLARYEALLKGSAATLHRLESGLWSLPLGRHALEGENYVLISHEQTSDRQPRLEVHRRYVDIQIVQGGSFKIGWRPLSHCMRQAGEFDAERDLQFFDDSWQCEVTVTPGTFAMLFPDDAHAPFPPSSELAKAVFKIRIA